jgi:hypothetical protein
MYAPIISPTNRPPKLRVELVPQTCGLSDVKSYMSEHHWGKLSREVAEDGDMRCEVCGGRGRQHAVECHEVWLFDDERRLQTLLRLQALCPMCHRVKHLDRAISNGYGEHACERLARVNGWDAAATRWYVNAVSEQWHARSQMHWALDLTVLDEVYEVGLERLNLSSYELTAHERQQLYMHRVTTDHR